MDRLLPPSSSASRPIPCEVSLTWTAPGTFLPVADHQPLSLISATLAQTCCIGLILPVCFRILQGRATVWSQHPPRALHKAGFRNIYQVAGPELPKSLWQEGVTFPLL